MYMRGLDNRDFEWEIYFLCSMRVQIIYATIAIVRIEIDKLRENNVKKQKDLSVYRCKFYKQLDLEKFKDGKNNRNNL